MLTGLFACSVDTHRVCLPAQTLRRSRLPISTSTDSRPVAANNGTQNIGILLGKAEGTCRPLSISACTALPINVLTPAFNGDGKPDGAVTNGSAVSILPGNGDGTVGGDGLLDRAASISNNVEILLEKQTERFTWVPVFRSRGERLGYAC